MKWLSSKNRKKHQRRVNHYVRGVNKSIENDPLWKGRFYIRQIDSPIFVEYDDGSGGGLYVRFRLHDKVTGKTAVTRYTSSINHWCFLNGYRFFDIMNKFIIEIVDGIYCSSTEPIYYEEPN